MTTFTYLKTITESKSLPLTTKNDDGENVIIEQGAESGESFFIVVTAQNNGWCRINTYWQDGTIEETYRK